MMTMRRNSMKKFHYFLKEILLCLLSALFITLLCNKLIGLDIPFFAIIAGWLIGDFIRYRSNKKRDRKIQEKLNG